MRIGIAARGLDGRGGVKQYIESLISAFLKIDKENEYYFFYNSPEFIGKYPEANEIVLNSSSKMFWDYYLLPKAAKKYNIDVMLFPKNVLPFFIKCKSLIVIHDLAYYMAELNAYPLIDRIYMRLMINSSVNRANHIIAVSENTKKDIIKFTGARDDKITVIHEASDKKYGIINNETDLNRIRHKYSLSHKFILSHYSLSPRKNINRLLIAFNSLNHKIPHELVLVGGGSFNSKIENNLNNNSDSKVVNLGYVEDEDMPILYNLADLFVYPSLYEGFGLPPLEAMACGCPVISSNTSSLPEVVGDASSMIDPYNIEELAKTIYDVLTDNMLREDKIRKGLERKKLFSWEKCAEEYLKIFKDV